jgi:hypothetical protein
VITKNHLITRRRSFWRSGRRLLGAPLDSHPIPSWRGCSSRAPDSEGRLHAIETLAKAGIPVGVMVAPVILASPTTRSPHPGERRRRREQRRLGDAAPAVGVKDV